MKMTSHVGNVVTSHIGNMPISIYPVYVDLWRCPRGRDVAGDTVKRRYFYKKASSRTVERQLQHGRWAYAQLNETIATHTRNLAAAPVFTSRKLHFLAAVYPGPSGYGRSL